jgi:hypothetical protein
MIIGVDFDNTIVCYDQVFHAVAMEQGLIPPELPATKSAVRDFLRRTDRESAWTELQGYVYGQGMRRAEAFPGAEEFFLYCKGSAIVTYIISHKTRHPFIGPKYDLHECSQRWLEEHGFYNADRIGLRRNNVFFEVTREAKIDRISQLGCDIFVDDLAEFLSESAFPPGVTRVLFDSSGTASADLPFTKVRSWDRMKEIICSRVSQS